MDLATPFPIGNDVAFLFITSKWGFSENSCSYKIILWIILSELINTGFYVIIKL